MVQDETIPNHDFKQSGLERKERDSRGKRVPGVEINF